MRPSQFSVVVTGLPCAGKTTLALALAECLDAQYIGVGDLIRARRSADVEFRCVTDTAFAGRECLQPEYIAAAIRHVITDLRQPMIIDGGPNIDLALALCGVEPTLYLDLRSGDRERARRFALRSAALTRSDNDMQVFAARSIANRQGLAELRTRVSDLKRFPIRAWGEPRAILTAALSAVLLGKSLLLAAAPPITTSRCEWMSAMICCDGSTGRWAESLIEDGLSALGNQYVLLVKPGLTFSEQALRTLDHAIQVTGHKVIQASLFKGSGQGLGDRVRAHFDKHYIYSRWGSYLIRAEDLGHDPGKVSVRGGYEYSAESSLAELRRVWVGDGTPTGPCKRAECLWVVRDPRTDTWIVNGHMPFVLAPYFRRDTHIMALHLAAVDESHVASWEDMRDSFLGSADPHQARQGSVRARLLSGDIAVKGLVSIRNNGVHLSASPQESLRELAIWFGQDTALRVLGHNINRQVHMEHLLAHCVDYQRSAVSASIFSRCRHLDFQAARMHRLLRRVAVHRDCC